MISMSFFHSREAHKWYTLFARGLFVFIAGVIPLTVVPWTIDQLEINKQTVLLVGGSFILLAIVARTLTRRSLVVRAHPAFLFLGIFLVFFAISCVLSSAPYTSWMGGSGQQYLSFLTVAVLSLLAFSIGLIEEKPVLLVRQTVTVSVVVSAIIGFLVSLAILGFPVVSTGFIGTPDALAIYLITLSTLGCAATLFMPPSEKTSSQEKKGDWSWWVIRIAAIITSISTVIVLLAVSFWLWWVLLIFVMAVLFVRVFAQVEQGSSLRGLLVPMALTACAILFLIFPSPIKHVFPLEVSPSYATSWHVTASSLGEHSWVFGAGPGTFVEAYTKFRPAELNATKFWDVRFDRPSSHLLSLLQGTGVLGIVFFLLWSGWVFMGGWTASSQREDEMSAWRHIVWLGWIVLALGTVVYSSNMTLTFLFFLFSGLILALVPLPAKTIIFAQSPRAALASTFISVFCTIALLTLLFVTGSRYAAEWIFARAVSAEQAGSDIDTVLKGLDTSARLNRWSDDYYRNLAHALFLKIAQQAKDPGAKPEEIQSLVASAINAARQATTLAPQQVVNWSLLGDMYREIAPIAGGADAFAISAYEKAIELAPANPKYEVSLGRAYLAQAETQEALLKTDDKDAAAKAKTIRDTALTNAITHLLKAGEEKNDYAPAHYYLAAAYERQGNLSDAIMRMEEVKMTAPSDVGVALQLGLLYLRQGKTDAGQTELERAVRIAPNFSNARWFLSAVYEQKGEYDKAIDQVNEVAKYNENNDLITQRLARLNEEKITAEAPPDAVETTPLEEGEAPTP